MGGIGGLGMVGRPSESAASTKLKRFGVFRRPLLWTVWRQIVPCFDTGGGFPFSLWR
ncbi:hypothetical protein NEIELOOT_02062 [Neisseria elongata subsp. glycolytica ATCC 29315]|uniref:Uncharacterized protein n=1 Tax=Neisseria elongata subsp. glycolytica ATCC 29315 TaxID=546263 RepID=D4DSL7_NEIEG|nr:hypothetical protein NEIELOOT_02062 [Neisseria elongata subsp. glycolytica ATCC 29315]